MNIKEFKDNLINDTIQNNIIVFKCAYNGDFLFHQYINYYTNKHNKDIKIISALSELPLSNSLFGESNSFYVFETDELKEDLPNSANIVWVKCKKVNKKVSHLIVELNKLEDWQIKDYIYSMAIGVDTEDLDCIYNTYKSNLYRLENELDKLSIFEISNRKVAYNLIKNQLFTDVSEYSIFDLTDAVVKRDKATIQKLYMELENIDVDPFGLTKLLIDNFKRVIDIQLANNPTPESSNMSSKQFWAIKKYSCGHYSREELIYIYKFLLGIDKEIKTGRLDMRLVVDYIITHIYMI